MATENAQRQIADIYWHLDKTLSHRLFTYNTKNPDRAFYYAWLIIMGMHETFEMAGVVVQYDKYK